MNTEVLSDQILLNRYISAESGAISQLIDRHSNRIRDYIRENFWEFDAILRECPIPLSGEQLKTMPRGYDAADPAAELLRYNIEQCRFAASRFAE